MCNIVLSLLEQLEFSYLFFLLPKAEFAATDSEEQISRAAKLYAAATKVLKDVNEGKNKAFEAIKHVADLATGLELSEQPKIDSALTEAKQIKSDIAGGLSILNKTYMEARCLNVEPKHSFHDGGKPMFFHASSIFFRDSSML